MIIPGKNDYKKLLAGCNGLLLLSGYDYGLYVCNLVTRRNTALPAFPCRLGPLSVIYGRWVFFYDTYVGRYKLFGICSNDVLMLTSGDKKWKKLTLPFLNWGTYLRELTTPVFADKELHWLAYTFEVINTKRVTKDFMIYSLDVKSSEFRKIKLPTLNAEHYNMFISSKNEESLWFAAVFPDHLDVWGLSNNGMTKKYSVSLQKLSYIPEFWSKMCIVEDSGDSNDIFELKLFIKHENEWLYHDLKTGVLRQIGKTNTQTQFLKLQTYLFHVDSLVSWHPTDEYKRKIDD
ncbi:hypothetical protein FRX31_024167 [Thalictrum thalictroides]|uniref:F-box associated domain-containing protein n=1 Tax=Thalictrum thalictroides TaxID=46969 RepID=A0A7J6VMA7_THATH|nr:hypothetical protein FRX31_024167 [Thalictrum thalictroides]